MRLIDADALLRHEVEADRMGAMLVVGKGYILEEPEIDAVSVVRGEWKKDSDYPWLLNCSVCGYSTERGTNYCPNCGAKMEDKP